MNLNTSLIIAMLCFCSTVLLSSPPPPHKSKDGHRPAPAYHHQKNNHHRSRPAPPPKHHHRKDRSGLETAADILSIVGDSLGIVRHLTQPAVVQPVTVVQPQPVVQAQPVVVQPIVVQTAPEKPEKPRPVSITILPDGTKIEKY